MKTIVFAVIFLVSHVSVQAGNYTALKVLMCKDFWDCKRCLKIKNENKCKFGFYGGVCYKTCTGCGPYVDQMDNCTSIAKQGKCFKRETVSPFTTPALKCEKSCCIDAHTKPKQALPYWAEWSFWGACSKTCSSGYKKRTRVCHTAKDGTYCKGYKSTDYKSCNWGIPCYKVDGGWSKWSTWSSCQSSCGRGKTMRTRQCSNPYPRNGGKSCNGSSEQVKTCYAGCCPEPGSWGTWSAWSSCSDTNCSPYASGKRERTRSCSQPRPYCGGPPCYGSWRETQKCSAPCPTATVVVPIWSSWSNWSSCSKTCMSYGYRTRTRSCINWKKTDQYCKGHSKEYEWCNANVPC